MSNKVILIRHGRSTGNEDHSFYKHNVDAAVCLTQLGVSQALYAGQKLAEIHNDYLQWQWHGVLAYASNFTRAQQTSRIVLDKMGMKHIQVENTPGINERFYGDNDLPDDWHTNPYATCTNGESLMQAKDRFVGWWNTVEHNLSQKDIVLFCHGEILMGITAHLLGLSPEELLKVSSPNAVPYIYEQVDGKYIPSQHKFERYDKSVVEVIH